MLLPTKALKKKNKRKKERKIVGYIENLTSELDNDPLVRGYPSMSDGRATNDMNSVYRTMSRPVNSRRLLEWGAAEGRAKKLSDGRSNPDPILAAISITALALMERPDAELDPTNPAHVAAINALVAGSILSTGDRDALLALATVPGSRADELFGRNVTFVDLAIARGRP